MNWMRLCRRMELEGENFACAVMDRCDTHHVWMPYWLTIDLDIRAIITYVLAQYPDASMVTHLGYTKTSIAMCEVFDDAIEFTAAMARQQV